MAEDTGIFICKRVCSERFEVQELTNALDALDMQAEHSAAEEKTATLVQPTIEAVIEKLQRGDCMNRRSALLLTLAVKNVVVMCGAGISVAAGIPDFR